jgi:hypothetical protein
VNNGTPTGEVRPPMINPWIQGRVPGMRGTPTTLGAWQNRRTLASAPFVPPEWFRRSLFGTKPFWYQFPALVLAASQTLLTNISTSEDFWVLCVLGNASVSMAGGSYRVQIYEDANAYKWMKQGVNSGSYAPNAQEPGLQHLPHFIEGGSPVNCRVQNLAAQANTVYLSLFGYSGAWRR